MYLMEEESGEDAGRECRDGERIMQDPQVREQVYRSGWGL